MNHGWSGRCAPKGCWAIRGVRRGCSAAASILLMAGGIAIGWMTAVPPADPPQTVQPNRFLFMLTNAEPVSDDAARAEHTGSGLRIARKGPRRFPAIASPIAASP